MMCKTDSPQKIKQTLWNQHHMYHTLNNTEKKHKPVAALSEIQHIWTIVKTMKYFPKHTKHFLTVKTSWSLLKVMNIKLMNDWNTDVFFTIHLQNIRMLHTSNSLSVEMSWELVPSDIFSGLSRIHKNKQ